MTVEEKRDAIFEYCNTHPCDEKCGLFALDPCEACWSEGADIERNYKILFGSDDEPEAKDTTKGKEEMEDNKGCESCKHTHKTEEEYPCIACKRNYSYVDEAHWKHPDRWEAKEENRCCDTCKYAHISGADEPCYTCVNDYAEKDSRHSKWEPAEAEKQKESKITPTVEEMNEVIQEHCEDCYSCPIEDFCDKVEGAFHNHPDECRAAYNILQETKAQTSDAVNHPAHYQGKHECIDEMIALFGKHAVMNFCACNVYKYRYRAAAKNGQEDLDKANWYMDKLIELKGESNDPF